MVPPGRHRRQSTLAGVTRLDRYWQSRSYHTHHTRTAFLPSALYLTTYEHENGSYHGIVKRPGVDQRVPRVVTRRASGQTLTSNPAKFCWRTCSSLGEHALYIPSKVFMGIERRSLPNARNAVPGRALWRTWCRIFRQRRVDERHGARPEILGAVKVCKPGVFSTELDAGMVVL
jgi:hypothetical protein